MKNSDGEAETNIEKLVVAEKVSALNTAEYFTRRGKLADLDAFDRIMDRKGGQPPARDECVAGLKSTFTQCLARLFDSNDSSLRNIQL
jgi:hypothetical protein